MNPADAMAQDSESLSYNLIEDPWIPVRRKSGEEDWIHPWEVTGHINGESPITKLSAPRPDFNGALIQFLIGLVQTAFSPETQRDWRKALQNPPSPATLKDAFSNHKPAFDLVGETPRFLQDYGTISDASQKAIAGLLVDSPSAYALRQHRDHFIKDRTKDKYCPACTATALFALQTNAPQGGRGHRTSIRGGGPVTTVVMGRNLWHTIWLNVLPNAGQELEAPSQPRSDVYPWLGPTRASGGGTTTTPEDGHPLQVFWGMPRRIFLEAAEEDGGPCDLCGRAEGFSFTQYRTTSHGTDYTGPWEHPLTPHYRTDDGELRPRHGQQDGFSYRHWRGYAIGERAIGEGEGQMQSAQVVRTFYERTRYAGLDEVFESQPRLWAFGFETDRTKIRAWHESLMPLFRVSGAVRPRLERLAGQLIGVADSTADTLTQSLRKALYGYPSATTTGKTDWNVDDDATRDHTLFENAEVQFWQDTEPAFYETLRGATGALEEDRSLDAQKRGWAKRLQKEAVRLFDEVSQHGRIQAANPKAISVARQELRRFSSPSASSVRKALDLPAPKEETAR